MPPLGFIGLGGEQDQGYRAAFGPPLGLLPVRNKLLVANYRAKLGLDCHHGSAGISSDRPFEQQVNPGRLLSLNRDNVLSRDGRLNALPKSVQDSGLARQVGQDPQERGGPFRTASPSPMSHQACKLSCQLWLAQLVAGAYGRAEKGMTGPSWAEWSSIRRQEGHEADPGHKLLGMRCKEARGIARLLQQAHSLSAEQCGFRG
jgi:hypothetical protein